MVTRGYATCTILLLKGFANNSKTFVIPRKCKPENWNITKNSRVQRIIECAGKQNQNQNRSNFYFNLEDSIIGRQI